MEVIVVEAGYGYGEDRIVGVFSSFDKAVAATEAYTLRHGSPSDGFCLTVQCVDMNNTGSCTRYESFILEEGTVPAWFSYSPNKEQGE